MAQNVGGWLKATSPSTPRIFEESCKHSGWDHLQPTSRLLKPRQYGHYYHVKVMEMDETCVEKRTRQHLLHSPSLNTRAEAEMRASQEHLALNWRGGAKEIPSHLGGPFRSWSRTERNGVPLLLPNMPAGITGMSSRECAAWYKLYWVWQNEELNHILKKKLSRPKKAANVHKVFSWR